jgi:hypothetical protein
LAHHVGSETPRARTQKDLNQVAKTNSRHEPRLVPPGKMKQTEIIF